MIRKLRLNWIRKRMYHGMASAAATPDPYTMVALLKDCAKLKDLERGSILHSDILREGLLDTDVYVGSTLVDMYVKCGALDKAEEVFNVLPFRNVVCWNALIAGYAKNQKGSKALDCLRKMCLEGVPPNAVTYTCCLKACASIRALEEGCQIHDEVINQGFLNDDHLLGSALVNMYAECGALSKAQEVFDELHEHSVASWNVLISGYAKHEHAKEALECFEQMQDEGISPDAVTFASCLKACSSLKDADKGREIHLEIDRKGLWKRDLVLGSALVDMYAKCGMLEEAKELCEGLSVRDAVAWTALIAGFGEHERGEEALNCYLKMQSEGIAPDAITLACCLHACGSIGATFQGSEIHAEVERKTLIKKDVPIGNALVDMYIKFKSLAKAREVFDKLPKRNTITWNALITGYINHDQPEEALCCLEQMQRDNVSPDSITFTCGLKACGSISAIDKGRDLHNDIDKSGLLEKDSILGNALVDMYAKCGYLAKAQEVFDFLSETNLVSWNTLVAGYAQQGQSEDAFVIFERMEKSTVKPDMATFASILKACTHAGLLDKAETYFNSMINQYSITPTAEHFTSMVDLLGRAGQLDKALAMLVELPFHPDVAMWCIFLSACRKWGNVDLAREAFEQAMRSDDKEAPLYVCMYNVYADADMHEEANKVEEMRVKKQAWTKPGGCWWMDDLQEDAGKVAQLRAKKDVWKALLLD